MLDTLLYVASTVRTNNVTFSDTSLEWHNPSHLLISYQTRHYLFGSIVCQFTHAPTRSHFEVAWGCLMKGLLYAKRGHCHVEVYIDVD